MGYVPDMDAQKTEQGDHGNAGERIRKPLFLFAFLLFLLLFDGLPLPAEIGSNTRTNGTECG